MPGKGAFGYFVLSLAAVVGIRAGRGAVRRGQGGGGETAAILSSVTSTCRRHGIDPQIYLTQLLTNLPTTPVSQLDKWLPAQWQPPMRGV